MATQKSHARNKDTILTTDGITALFNAGFLKRNLLVDNGFNIQIDEIRARDIDGLKLFDDGGNGLFVADGGNVGLKLNGTSPSFPFHASVENGNNYIAFDAYGNEPAFIGRRANGTRTNPTVAVDGSNLLVLKGRGWAGSAFSGSTVEITFEASETYSPTAEGSRIDFLVTKNGTTTKAVEMRLTNNARLGIGTLGPDSKVEIVDTLNVLANLAVEENYHLKLRNPNNTNGQGIGISFGMSSTGSQQTAAIVAKRTGSNGQGTLSFYTKQSTVSGAAPVLAVTIDQTGGVFMFNLKSGSTQSGAGAAINELWVDTNDDNTLKLGV